MSHVTYLIKNSVAAPYQRKSQMTHEKAECRPFATSLEQLLDPVFFGVVIRCFFSKSNPCSEAESGIHTYLLDLSKIFNLELRQIQKILLDFRLICASSAISDLSSSLCLLLRCSMLTRLHSAVARSSLAATRRVHDKTAMVALSNTLALGAGCYWGTEKYVVVDFQKQFPNSIKDSSVGFMSPDPDAMENPSYRQVCSGTTGHVEVLNVELTDPDKHFEELIKFFFMFHDPTTKNRQGNDAGTQYASVIFCSDQEQSRISPQVKEDLQRALDAGKVKYESKKVETAIVPARKFFPAHEEHQEYLMKNPLGYCNHRFRFREWPALN